MYPGGYTTEVTSFSPKVTEKEVYEFFAHCGALEHLEIIRSSGYASTAYVTFRDAFALKTAVLLSGARMMDQRVCITQWGLHMDEPDIWNTSSWTPQEDIRSSTVITQTRPFVSTPGEAINIAQEVVKTMLAKGYVLARDALTKAKEFDEANQVSASASAKVSDLTNRIGLANTINRGREMVKYVDEKFHVLEITKSAATITGTAAVVAVTITGKATVAARSGVVNSSHFAKGALWISDLLTRASQAEANLGSHGK